MAPIPIPPLRWPGKKRVSSVQAKSVAPLAPSKPTAPGFGQALPYDPAVRPAAPHVQRAMTQPLHVQRPVLPAQAKAAGGLRPLAAHVQAALLGIQTKLPATFPPPPAGAPRTPRSYLHSPFPIQMMESTGKEEEEEEKEEAPRRAKRKNKEEEEEEAPRRSMRKRTIRVVDVSLQTLRSWYDSFAADETDDTTSGTTTTAATLQIDGESYPGQSGHGHAEMDALNKILKKYGSLEKIQGGTGKTVNCTAKPCCYRCSIVLGLLGFAPHDDNTTKTPSGMGSTEWGLQEPLKGALKERYGDIQNLLANFSNATKLPKEKKKNK